MARFTVVRGNRFDRRFQIIWALTVIFACGFSQSALEASEYFVAVDGPNASDTNDGLSLAQPFKTLAKAVQPLRAGDTLTIAAGTYREPLEAMRSGTASSPIVIRALPGDEGMVIISGSDVVANWNDEGAGVWSVSRDPLALIDHPPSWPDYYGEYSRRREMVFVDATPWQQVLSQSELESGSFWVDDDARRLYISLTGNPNNRMVEVATRDRGIVASGLGHINWIGLSVQHVTPDYFWIAAMETSGSNNEVSNCRIEYNNGNGVTVSHNALMMNTAINHNGRIGIALEGNNCVLDSNETNHNSWRYGPLWASGGIKAIGDMASGNHIVRHTSSHNNGPGIWFDTTGSGNVVEACLLESNTVSGLEFEATIGPNWAINNVVIGTRLGNIPYSQQDGVGIAMREALDTRVYNNTIVGVQGAGILISGDEREQFYAADTQVYNNIVVNSGTFGVYMWLWGNAVLEPRVSSHRFDNNLYFNNPKTIIFADFSNGQWIAWQQWSLAQWQANRGQDMNSLGEDPEFVRYSVGDVSLTNTSPAIDSGRFLSEVPVGCSGRPRPHDSRFDIGAFECPRSGYCVAIAAFDFEDGMGVENGGEL